MPKVLEGVIRDTGDFQTSFDKGYRGYFFRLKHVLESDKEAEFVDLVPMPNVLKISEIEHVPEKTKIQKVQFFFFENFSEKKISKFVVENRQKVSPKEN